MKKHSAKAKSLSFQSRLERIATGMEYYALSIPLKITTALGTRGPVPVSATVNNSEKFIASLYPVGEGRHYLRVRNKICKSVNMKAGDRVRVQVTVRDRNSEITIPKDLTTALKAQGVVANFKALPIGKKGFLLRLIKEAAKPETRHKRILDAVKAARQRR